MNKNIKIIVGVLVLFVSLVILAFSYYVFQLSPVSEASKVIQVEIPKGSAGSKVASILKENNLIKDVLVFRAYLKIHQINNISYGLYELNENMGVQKIVDIISDGKVVSSDIKVLFKEGLNMRGIAKTIAANTNNSEEDVYTLLKDEDYIDSLIAQYWFLSDIIKNDSIYYPLEGYLAPNTYQFASKDVSVKDIFKRMLDQTDKILTPYKNNLKKYTIHQLLTLASIVESESINDEDRLTIAGVFYNRLNNNWSLGSCPTACYAMKLDHCVSSAVNTKIVSPYNTYLSSMAGKLPVGPISNPGENAIQAAIIPAETPYFYFLSDKNKKTYFSRTGAEQDAKKRELQEAGLWLADEYE